MSRNKRINEGFREQLAKELGVYDTVKIEGWVSTSARNCDNIVTKAVDLQQKNLNK